MVTFYTKPQGGELTLEEAIKKASQQQGEGALEEEMERIVSWNVSNISWHALDAVFRSNPSYAEQLWEEIKDQALMDFETGHFAAAMFEHTEWQKDVWKRAHFVAVYQEMISEYQPQGAIEHSMVEMVTVNYFLWQHWVGEHLQRATTEPRLESQDYQEWRQREENWKCGRRGAEPYTRRFDAQYTKGHWDIPYQQEAEAVEHAAQLADRFRRAYQSGIRTLRDWRRYNVPVTINNPQQVNIAADGGQQTNVIKKGKKKATKERGDVVVGNRKLKAVK